MLRKILYALIFIYFISTLAHASGYRIPQQSLDSTALAGANIAGGYGADASYYNPANMAFSPQKNELEIALTYIHLVPVRLQKDSYREDSLKEDFIVPHLFYRSKPYDPWSLGFAFVAPAGLSKRWHDGVHGQAKAYEFTLEVLELNPSFAYQISDNLALGAGIRGIYTQGIVQNKLTNFSSHQKLKGNSLNMGYNLALAYRPIPTRNLGLTYRSKVDLTVTGDSSIETPLGKFKSDTHVTVPLPAVFSIAWAQSLEQWLVEFAYERIYWSAYKTLDFEYASPMNGNFILQIFDSPKPKGWKDVNTYRLGVTYNFNSTLKIMTGIGIDKNPIPTKHVSYELPDSDAIVYSMGGRYSINQNNDLGVAPLISDKENCQTPEGSFSNTRTYLFTAGYAYRY